MLSAILGYGYLWTHGICGIDDGSIVVLILLLGGIQLTVMGIIGEYLGKVHVKVKNRPIYIAKEIIRSEKVEE